MTSLLVGGGVQLTLLTLEEADYDDLPNLGISRMTTAGWMESSPVLESPLHGRPIVHATFCSFAAAWVKGNSAYTFVELLKACFKLDLFSFSFSSIDSGPMLLVIWRVMPYFCFARVPWLVVVGF